jgi:hypothetical protein
MRDRGPGLRAAGLDIDARAGRGRTPLGAETALPAPPDSSPAAAAARGSGSPASGPGPAKSPPRSPGCRHSRLDDQPGGRNDQGRRTPGPVEPRPTQRDSRASRNDPAWNMTHQTTPQAGMSQTRNIEVSVRIRSPVSQSLQVSEPPMLRNRQTCHKSGSKARARFQVWIHGVYQGRSWWAQYL